jgi:hypothetical protein
MEDSFHVKMGERSESSASDYGNDQQKPYQRETTVLRRSDAYCGSKLLKNYSHGTSNAQQIGAKNFQKKFGKNYVTRCGR